jgi:E3 Ubiquitin ligase
MKKHLQLILAIVIVVPIAVMFLPLFYICFLMMIPVVPPLLFGYFLFEDRDKNKPLTLKDALAQFVSIMIFLPLVLFMITSILHSVLTLLSHLHPKALFIWNDFHNTFIYKHGIPVFGDLFPYWLDVFWGISGVLVLFVLAILDSIRRNMLVRQIEILPTSKIHAAAIGLIELKGKAVPIKTKKSEPIILSRFEDKGDGMYGTTTTTNSFYLDDGTGQILIDPKGCHLGTPDNIFEIELHHAILKSYQPERGLPESRLMPGDDVYVLGNLQINNDPKFESDKVIIKPQKSSLKGFHVYDLFFLSNTSEEELIAAFKKAIKRGWLSVFLLMIIPGWLAINGWTNVTQLKVMDVEAAPALFRFVTTSTTLERKVTIDDVSQPTHYWLEQLTQSPDKTDDIMWALKEQRQEKLAIPTLQKHAIDIDHPAFGIANAWLQKLNALPEGYSGHEYARKEYLEEYERNDNTFVSRVKLNYNNPQLLASYRVHFGDVISDHFELTKRYVVFELTHKETGEVKHMEFFSNDGWNNVDQIQVFDYLLPGEYSVYIYAKRVYRNGRSDKGSRRFKAFDVTF